MSVLVSDRKESKFEAITFSVELHNMLLDFMQRNFGVKDLEQFVRIQYAYGKEPTENFSKYRYLMINSIYPTSMHEYEERRDYQNKAIINCEQIIKELQRIVEIFEVDINVYGRYVKAIDREIGLIKKWRQRDRKIKSYLPPGNT